MIILHYTLGFPPERSGGLVKYAMDLMNEQQSSGDEVIALFPGKINFFNKKIDIIKSSDKPLKMYEMVNSLPLPLFGGIKEPQKFMMGASPELFERFFKKIGPDVIHVHTLMGLPKEFLEVAKKFSIKIVYTTHDYFGLSPNPTFYFNGKSFDNDNSVINWAKASENAFSTAKLRIFQMKSYPRIRKLLSKLHGLLSKWSTTTASVDKNLQFSNKYLDELQELKNYYIDIFKLVDVFHFNSQLTMNVYTDNLDFSIKGEVISITNALIKNRNIEYRPSGNKKIKIGYIGSNESYKGFYDFVRFIKLLPISKFEFHSFGYDFSNEIEGLVQHGKYNFNELGSVYDSIDVLIVPSRCKETFGLVALEALSYKTPVFVSKNVGSKDLIESDFIFQDNTELIKEIRKWNLKYRFNHVKTIQEHCKELRHLYLKQ
ncbi:glycosyltransferase [Companilactobacillus allii]|uniref:Glycosyltransferase subfamily 4-like N-terminal domain-containing protein n=1 Tax=Companilactobacillus allii TaxID=1847728 RepID=A0A1P8Q250_9LACO|nr:glycosyltransferase [Companilactobacillus allii]APX71954.1 hypothetical protein BTM29_05010 [Companilactobacillus allii]USQ69049.1 glycosyltransferase [Companilactobacillus allii]